MVGEGWKTNSGQSQRWGGGMDGWKSVKIGKYKDGT